MATKQQPSGTVALERLHKTGDVPQANRLQNVRQLVAAVGDGVHEVAALRELLHVDTRHFAYYRRAAEILGFLDKDADEMLRLTKRGTELLAASELSHEERERFLDAMLAAPALRPFATFLRHGGVPPEELAGRLQALTGLSPSTALRRAQTLAQWRSYVVPDTGEAALGFELPDTTGAIERLVARHNALAKQRYLEWLRGISPRAFEEVVGKLVAALGYEDVQITGRPGDGGIDVRARCLDAWAKPQEAVVQVKRYSRAVGRRAVHELVGVLTQARCAEAILVTTADFSTEAQRAAVHEPRLRLVNGAELVELLVGRGVGLTRGRHGELVAQAAAESPQH
jgi:hypothetical protein